MSYKPKKIPWFLILSLLCLGIVFWMYYLHDKKTNTNTPSSNTDQQTTETPQDIDWKKYITAVRKTIGSTFMETRVAESEPVSIFKTKDITGDGISEALISLGSGGAYTEYFALMQWDKTQGVHLARFKQKEGTVGDVLFLEGASASHGMNVILDNEIKSIISSHWNIDPFNPDAYECEFEVYTWNPLTNLFEFNSEQSKLGQTGACSVPGFSLDSVLKNQ